MLAVVFLALLVPMAACSKILALMTVASHSHHIWNSVYLEALVKKGHQITYLSVDTYKNKPDNIKHIFLEGAYDFYDEMNYTEWASIKSYSAEETMVGWYRILGDIIVKAKGFEEFLNIIKNEKFDLVVYDTGASQFLLGAVDKLGRPPLIGITAYSIPPLVLADTGTPYPIVNNPHLSHWYDKEMSFWERLDNAGLFLYTEYLSHEMLREENVLAKKMFGDKIRDIKEIRGDMTISMVNSNWVTDSPFPTAPGLISVGGLHIAAPKPLPKELKLFLDSSPEGVIYFSMGSNIRSSLLGKAKLDILTKAFVQLAPVKVLWKFEDNDLANKPANVRIEKWLPQNDILSHPNIRLFFTHGGMLSTQEAMYHGKPIVGMPVFVDQHANIKKAVNRGIGESISFTELNVEGLVSALKKVLKDPRYSEKIIELSKIFRDQQNSPLDSAVYWTEYAIRHRGASHLRPVSKSLPWYFSGLYDSYLVIFLIAIIGTIALFELLVKLCRSTKKQKKD